MLSLSSWIDASSFTEHVDWNRKLEFFEEEYLYKRSFIFDLSIIFKTIFMTIMQKNITTLGEGGMIYAKNNNLASKISLYNLVPIIGR